MVGVPGRSKACSTCLARKKGCDKKTPSCGQCTRAALVCGGYVRELTWVSAEYHQNRPKASYRSSANHENRRRPAGSGSAQLVSLQDSLVASARAENLIGLFWASYLPGGCSISLKASSLSAGGWLSYIGNLHQAEPALRQAIYAISCTMLGVRDGNDQLRVKGLQTYTSSLQEMSRALKDPKRATSDGLLSAIRIMSCYQVLFGRDAEDFSNSAHAAQIDGWTSHSDGELALARVRGPHGFTSAAGHQLYVDGLMNAITNCMARRKRSVFEGAPWRTEPWKGRSKTLKDQLLDVVVDIPGYMEDLDNLEKCPDQTERLQKRSDLLQRCLRTNLALLDWETNAGSKIQKFDHAVTGLPVPGLAKTEDLDLLHLTCFYWAMCIQLHLVLGSLLRESSSPGGDQADTPTGSLSHLDPKGYACKIVHCVHLHFDPRAGGLGANLGIMPLAVAWFHLEDDAAETGEQSEELKLLYDLIAQPALGLYVSRFLDSLRCVMVPLLVKSDSLNVRG